MSPRRQFAALVAEARRAVVFTGAGISTESGIPDFRSPGGVWSRMKPIYFDEFVSSEAKRREAWTRTFSGVMGWTGAKPNAGHYAVARLVARDKVAAVITQNVDNLHQEAGIPPARVIELHGNASYAKCLDCGLRHELEVLKQSFLGRGEIPVCRDCGGLVKTATISFGQAMPEEPMRRAQEVTLASDVFIVLGSSLVVYPAAGFPLLAKENGARLVIVNREPTEQDRFADLVIHDEIGPVMSEAVPSIEGFFAMPLLPSLSGPVREPRSGAKATSLVVFLHGVGADGQDLIGIAEEWAALLPDAAFVSPDAPFPYDMAPFGRQWFSLQDRSPEHVLAGVRAAAPLLDAFLDEALSQRGLEPSRLALVGFSQGTMMSLYVGLRRSPAVAAIVGYSGALVGAENLAAEIRARPPVFLGHGTADEVVPVERFTHAASALVKVGVKVEQLLRPGLGHGIDHDGLRRGGAFLKAALQPA